MDRRVADRRWRLAHTLGVDRGAALAVVLGCGVAAASPALAAVPSNWSFSFQADGGVVARGVVAWLEQEHRRQAPRLTQAVKRADPLTPFEEWTPLGLQVNIGPLGYRVNGRLTVRSTALGTAEVDLAFDATGTLGEGRAWKKVATPLPDFIEAYIAEAERPRTSEEVLADGARRLRDPQKCRSAAMSLKGSSYTEASTLLASALGEIPADCERSVILALTVEEQRQQVLDRWLASEYDGRDPAGRAALAALVRGVTSKTPGMVAVLEAEDLAREAQQAAQREQTTVARAKRLEDARSLVAAYEGRWTVAAETSPVDDGLNVFVSVRAEGTVTGWPEVTYRPELWFRCQEGVSSAFVVTGMDPHVEWHKNSLEWATVTVRFDGDPATEVAARKSTDGRGLFLTERPADIEAMVGHDSMFFRFTPFRSAPAATTFDVSGLEAALQPLRLACGW